MSPALRLHPSNWFRADLWKNQGAHWLTYIITVNSPLYLTSLANYTRTYILLPSFDLISLHAFMKIMTELLGKSLAGLLPCCSDVYSGSFFGAMPYHSLLSLTNPLQAPDSVIHQCIPWSYLIKLFCLLQWFFHLIQNIFPQRTLNVAFFQTANY